MDGHLRDESYSQNWHSFFWLTHNKYEFGLDYLNEVEKKYIRRFIMTIMMMKLIVY